MAFSKFLGPKNDVAFRNILGLQQHKDILIIELKKCTTTQIEELENIVEKWCYFFARTELIFLFYLYFFHAAHIIN